MSLSIAPASLSCSFCSAVGAGGRRSEQDARIKARGTRSLVTRLSYHVDRNAKGAARTCRATPPFPFPRRETESRLHLVVGRVHRVRSRIVRGIGQVVGRVGGVVERV